MAKKSITLADIKVNMSANSVAYNRELQKANRQTRDWAAETRQHVNTVGKYITGLGVAAGASVAVIYKSAAAANDELAKQSDRLGISTQALAGYRHAAELTGVSQEKFDSSIERMVKRMGEAENGFGAAKSALDQYGLANQAFFNQTPEQQFETLADTIQGMGSASEKAAFAAAVFGREGVALVNTANLGGEGIRTLKEEAEALGLVVNRVDAAKIEAANDAMTRAKSGFKGFSNSIAVEMAPLVEAVANMFTDATKNSNGWRDQVINGTESVVMSVGYVANSITGIEIAFKAAQVAVAMFATGALQTFQQIESGWIEIYNLITPDSMSIDPSNTIISIVAKEAKLRTDELKGELQDLAMAELPSDKIQNFFDEIRKNSQAAAEDVANAASAINAPASKDVGVTYDATVVAGVYEVDKSMLEGMELEQLQLTEHYAKQQGILFDAKEAEYLSDQEFKDRSTRLQQNYESKQVAIIEKSESEKQRLKKASDMAALAAFQGVNSQFMDVLEASGQQQGALYKAAFLMQKAAAIPSMVVSTNEAATKSLTMDPSGTFGHAIRAMGYASIGVVAGQAIAGIAHGGLENVPEEATYLLQKNERVLSPKQNEALTAAADRINAGTSSGVIVNFYEDADRAGQVSESQGPNGEQMIDVFVANIRQGGAAAQQLEGTYGLSRQGR